VGCIIGDEGSINMFFDKRADNTGFSAYWWKKPHKPKSRILTIVNNYINYFKKKTP